MRYLTAEELLAIHQRIFLAIGGLERIRDVGLLYSIAERPKMVMMGREFYPDLFSKAAAYFEGLATYHVFADGNKRTAITATAVFLRANGYHLKIEEEQGFHFVLAVATKKKTMEEIVGWLKKHGRKI